MKNFTMRSSLLGLFSISAAMSVGCAAGSEDPASTDPVGSADQDQIVALGAPVISGCNVSQLFAVNSAQNLGFIAVQGQNLQNLNLQLYTVNQAGQSTLLNQAAQATTTAMQSMLSNASQA